MFRFRAAYFVVISGLWAICVGGCNQTLYSGSCPPGSLIGDCGRRCESDGDCLAPSRCEPLSSTCQLPIIACDPLSENMTSPSGDPLPSSSTRCRDGQQCDLVTRICVPRSGAPCRANSDCRTGESCQETVCAPTADAALCQRDSDCLAPSICRLILRGSQLVSLCGAPIGSSEAGARCRANVECRSGLCLRSGVCYGGCSAASQDTDCNGHSQVICGTSAISLPINMNSSALFYITGCTLRPPACQNNRDCATSGGVCQLLIDPENGTKLRSGCLLASGQARSGAPCLRDGDCETALCQGTYCFAACRSSADCRPGFACRLATYQTEGKSSRFTSCVPAHACTSRASCVDTDETCAPQPNATEDGLELVCTPGQGRASGAACTSNSDCMSGECYSRDPDHGLCIGGCALATDCPRGPASEVEECRPLSLQVRGVTGTVNVCELP